MCGKNGINWILGNNCSVQCVAVTCFCDTLILTESSSSTAASTPFFFFTIPWERVIWLFFRLSLCQFLVRSPGFLKYFCDFALECFRPLLIQSSIQPSHHENHLIWVDSSLKAPFELALLCAFGRFSWGGPASCLTLWRTIWSEWTPFGKSPLTLCNFSLSFLEQFLYVYTVHLLYIRFLTQLNDFHSVWSNILLQLLYLFD